MVPVSHILDCTHVESQVRENRLKEPPRQQQLRGSYVGEVLKVSVAEEATVSEPSAAVLNDGVTGEEGVRDLVPDGEVPSVRSVRTAHLDEESAALRGCQHSRPVHFSDLNVVDTLEARNSMKICRRLELKLPSKRFSEALYEHGVGHAWTQGARTFELGSRHLD